MAKHKVRVTLVAETEVEIEVEAAEDEDPADLTHEDTRRAIARADGFPTWEVERAEVVG